MKPIFSILFDVLTDPLGLPISPIWEYLILAVISAVAFRIAWEASPGGFGGSTIHWIVRIIAFVAIWAVTYAVIWVGKFLIAHWIPVACVAAGALILGVTGTIIYKKKHYSTV